MKLEQSEDKSHQLRMCISKKEYPTPKDAREVVRKNKKMGVRLRYYKCPYCDKYHMTKLKLG